MHSRDEAWAAMERAIMNMYWLYTTKEPTFARERVDEMTRDFVIFMAKQIREASDV